MHFMNFMCSSPVESSGLGTCAFYEFYVFQSGGVQWSPPDYGLIPLIVFVNYGPGVGGWEQGLYCPLIPTRICQNLANSGNSAESDLAEGPAKLGFCSSGMQNGIGIFQECKTK